MLSPALTADGKTAVMLVTTSSNPDGDRLATLFDWRVGILDGGGDTVRLIGPVLRGVTGLAVSPDGSKVALIRGSGKDVLTVLDVAGGEIRPVSTEGLVSDPAFSPDGRTIAYSSDYKSIKFAPVP